MGGIILVIALIGGVYAFGRYSSANEKSEKDDVIKNKDIDIIVKISLAFIASVIIVFTFVILLGLLGFQQDQIGITIIVFTMLLCTYAIIAEIRRFRDTK